MTSQTVIRRLNEEKNRLKDEFSSILKEARSLHKRRRYREAFERYLKLAGSGCEDVYLSLGWMYSTGNGTHRDFEKARYWYQLATGTGDGEAEWYLGRLYGKMGQNENGLELYRKSAELGYPPGIYRLANHYQFGVGTPKDEKKAFELMWRAFGKGNLKAQGNYARYLMRGYGGFFSVFRGIFLWVGMFVVAARVANKNFDDIRLRY